MVVGRPPRDPALPGGELESFFAVEPGLAHQFVNAFREALRGFAGAVGFGVVRRSDDESDFAARGTLGERRGEFGEAAMPKLLVDLGDFAGEAGVAVTENFASVGDGFLDAVRRFVKDDGAVFNAEALERAAAFTVAGGEKTGKEKFLIGHAGSAERGESGGRSGNGHHGNAMADAKGDQAMAGVGDKGHAGVADESDFCALFERKYDFGSASEFVVLVVAHQWLVNVVVGEKLLRVAGVLAGDLIDFLEDAEGAESDVLEIADGSADKIEAAGGAGRGVAHVRFRVIGGLGDHGSSVARERRESAGKGYRESQ